MIYDNRTCNIIIIITIIEMVLYLKCLLFLKNDTNYENVDDNAKLRGCELRACVCECVPLVLAWPWPSDLQEETTLKVGGLMVEHQNPQITVDFLCVFLWYLVHCKWILYVILPFLVLLNVCTIVMIITTANRHCIFPIEGFLYSINIDWMMYFALYWCNGVF